MKDWNVFDANKASFKVNHSYTYKENNQYVMLVTLTDKKQKNLQIAVYKNRELVGMDHVLFDDAGAKQDALDYIFMLKDFDWFRSDIKASNLRA